MFLKLGKILKKRNESFYANNGFVAGIVLGIIVALFSIMTVFLFKERFFSELSQAEKQYGKLIMLDKDSLYWLSIIVTPLVIVIVHSIIGLYIGIFINKIKESKNIVILLASITLGVIFGLITRLPANRNLILLGNIIAWVLFAIIFIYLNNRSKTQKNEV